MTDDQLSSDMKKYFSGECLYGDDFDAPSIKQWYQDEEDAYYDLAHSIPSYEYHQFNEYYGYSSIAGRKFKVCLAFGCANGDDVKSISNIVDRYIALEPAEKWWKNEIGGKPAQYVKPSVSGTIPLEDGTVEIGVCLGVLHHIPNVTHVVSEIYRVLSVNGVLLLREPIFSMGDWRQKRKGLTSRERGIPPQLLLDILRNAGFEVTAAYPCMVPITARIARLFGITNAYNSRAMVFLDRFCSLLLRWNMRYHRRNILEKLAPTSLYIVATKN
ncbi:MAG: class I SAM-dependent methyltransferase [Methylovulum sp.]|nr:class I SAM-dependent methyltransferase [Methylovulum sp.]